MGNRQERASRPATRPKGRTTQRSLVERRGRRKRGRNPEHRQPSNPQHAARTLDRAPPDADLPVRAGKGTVWTCGARRAANRAVPTSPTSGALRRGQEHLAGCRGVEWAPEITMSPRERKVSENREAVSEARGWDYRWASADLKAAT